MSDVISMKIPKSIVDQYRREFGLNAHLSSKEVVLYGLCAGLPFNSQTAFVKDHGLDPETMKRLSDVQKQINSDSVFEEVKGIKNALRKIHSQTAHTAEIHDLAERQDLTMQLIAQQVLRHGVTKNELREILERDRTGTFADSIAAIKNDGTFKWGGQ